MSAPASQQGYAVGIDVGSTKIAAGLVDLASGQILARERVPTVAERGPAALRRDLLALAEQLYADAPRAPRGIGVGLPELVGPDGAVTSAYLLDWREVALDEALAHLAPVRFEADVRAHARAEARFGAGRAFRLFAYVSVGSGISACLVQDEQPFEGARGNALVLSSGPLTLPCSQCGSMQRFVLEEYASGLALPLRYRQRGASHLTRAEQLFRAASEGDEVAREVLESAGLVLGSSVAWLVNLLDPEAVIVGGGLGLAGGPYWDSFVQALPAHVWAEASRGLPLLRAALGLDAGIVGAALSSLCRPQG
jgi:glucokinase